MITPEPKLPPLRDTGAMPYANEWARDMLRTLVPVGAQVPIYDSPAWHALPAEDPLRIAAAIRSAEARRSEIREDLEAIAAELDVAYRHDRELSQRVAGIVQSSARRLLERAAAGEVVTAAGVRSEGVRPPRG